MAAALSIREIYNAAITAGFTPHQAVTWTSIAFAESSGNPRAHNPKGEDSRGLWQINVRADAARATKYGNLYTPEANAKAAYEISGQGRDMRPWTTTHDANKGGSHDYRTYLGQVEREIGVRGDGRGVHGYGSDLPDPLPYADEVPAGAGSAGTADAAPTGTKDEDDDSDGLTNAFEDLAGTASGRRDTDRDGIDDAEEALETHTDPTSPDTDRDGMADALEVEAGSDPGQVAGVGGVVGTGRFQERAETAQDHDKDGLSDNTERLVGTKTGKADTDGDLVDDALEVALGTSPLRVDSDADGVADGLEVRYGSDPRGAVGLGRQRVETAAWTLEQGASDLGGGSAPASTPETDQPTDAQGGSATALASFLRLAKAQRGDTYDYGDTPRAADSNPESFDCSSLVQWAAARSGVKLERTAEYQYMQLKKADTLMDPDEALRTPGALMFYFRREPHGPLPPGDAHVVISLGDGEHVVEARNSSYGVGVWSAKGRTFNYAARVPGISDQASVAAYEADRAGGNGGVAAATATATADHVAPSGQRFRGADGEDSDADRDGLTAAFEELAGTDPDSADTDHDGVNDGEEALRTHTDPLEADTDRDGRNDFDEMQAGTDAGRIEGNAGVVGSGEFAENIRNGVKDDDQDGLSNRMEKKLGTSVKKVDSDGDKLADAAELSLGTDPLDPDSDDDGMLDWLSVTPGSPSAAGSLHSPLGVESPGVDVDPSDLPDAADHVLDPT